MQQVNLYQPILRKPDRVFSLNTLLLGNLVVALLLAAFYFLTLYQTDKLHDQKLMLEQQRAERTEKLAAMQKQYPPKEKDPTLTGKIKQREALLAHRRKLQGKLQQQHTGTDGRPGFSEQLTAFARQDVEAIWLQQIKLLSGNRLSLQGWATSPEEVPRMIQRLTREPSFAGTAFKRLQINRDEQQKNLVGFVLHTDDAKKGEQQ